MKFLSKICIPIQPTSMQDCKKLIDQASKKADIIEIWLDSIKDLNISDLMSFQKKPFLIVQKTGAKKITNVIESAKAGAKYIDLDIKTEPKKIPKLPPKTKLIISYHNFNRTPSEKKLFSIVNKAKKLNPSIIKIATKLRSHSDSLRLLQLLEKLTKSSQNAIVLGMGPLGPLNRIYGSYIGNYLTFVPLSNKTASASGQIPLDDLQKMINII